MVVFSPSPSPARWLTWRTPDASPAVPIAGALSAGAAGSERWDQATPATKPPPVSIATARVVRKQLPARIVAPPPGRPPSYRRSGRPVRRAGPGPAAGAGGGAGRAPTG